MDASGGHDKRISRRNARKTYSNKYELPLKRVDVPAALKDAIKHNDPPPTLATQLALGILNKLETAVADAETRILEIEEQILALQREKDDLIKQSSPSWAKMRVCDAVLSAFRRIPMEVLQEIASYAKPSQPSLDTMQSPMLLSHVCRKWRRAVHELPFLWRELYLEVELVGNKKIIQNYASRVKDWFSRTGSLSLSLRLYTPSDTSSIEAHGRMFIEHFLDPLRSIRLRVQHWGIGAPWVTAFIPLFKGKVAANAKSITLLNKAHGQPVDASEDCFQIFRHIRDVYLVVDHPLCPSSMLAEQAAPWLNVTSLSLRRTLFPLEYVNILNACPRLIFGQFTLAVVSIPPPLFPAPRHDTLDYLCLTVVGPMFNLSDILSLYSVHPTSLEIRHFGGPHVDYSRDGSLSVLRSIRRLAVAGDWEDSLEGLHNILAECENLTDLHLSVNISPHHLLDLLQRTRTLVAPYNEYEDPYAPFLPTLVRLSVDIQSDDPLIPLIATNASIMSLLGARATERRFLGQRECLKSFRISTKNQQLLEAISRIFTYCRNDVYLEVGPSSLRPHWVHRAVDEQLADWRTGVDNRLRIGERTMGTK